MSALKIVVWDNIGNTLLGMRPWGAWDERVQQRLLTEDANARERVVTIQNLLSDHDVDLVWLWDPEKAQRGFRALFDEVDARLVETTSEQVIVDELRDADFVIVHKEQLPPQALQAAEKVRLVQHLGRDARGVPMDIARQMQVPVAATPLVNYSAVAEHVWAMILTDAKRMVDQREYMASRAYQQEWGAYHPGVRLISDLTLGLVGLGEIARPVARVARAFGMRTLYWDIRRFPDVEAELGVEFVEWDEIFRQSDVLSMQLALNPQTEGIIGKREFGLMKPTALFINTARGRLVDEAALAEALQSGEIRAAAIDAYAEEPLPIDSPLHALHEADDHRVILTPHSAAQGPWTWIRDSQDLWFNIRRVLDGETVQYLIEGS